MEKMRPTHKQMMSPLNYKLLIFKSAEWSKCMPIKKVNKLEKYRCPTFNQEELCDNHILIIWITTYSPALRWTQLGLLQFLTMLAMHSGDTESPKSDGQETLTPTVGELPFPSPQGLHSIKSMPTVFVALTTPRQDKRRSHPQPKLLLGFHHMKNSRLPSFLPLALQTPGKPIAPSNDTITPTKSDHLLQHHSSQQTSLHDNKSTRSFPCSHKLRNQPEGMAHPSLSISNSRMKQEKFHGMKKLIYQFTQTAQKMHHKLNYKSQILITIWIQRVKNNLLSLTMTTLQRSHTDQKLPNPADRHAQNKHRLILLSTRHFPFHLYMHEPYQLILTFHPLHRHVHPPIRKTATLSTCP